MEEIIKVVEKYIHNIHTQKYDDFDQVWAKEKDCSLISVKTIYHQREEIYNKFYKKLGDLYSFVDLINDGIEVNKVNEQMAIVIFQYHTECIRKETNEAYGIKGYETQIIIKEKDEWRLLHVHYSK